MGHQNWLIINKARKAKSECERKWQKRQLQSFRSYFRIYSSASSCAPPRFVRCLRIALTWASSEHVSVGVGALCGDEGEAKTAKKKIHLKLSKNFSSIGKQRSFRPRKSRKTSKVSKVQFVLEAILDRMNLIKVETAGWCFHLSSSVLLFGSGSANQMPLKVPSDVRKVLLRRSGRKAQFSEHQMWKPQPHAKTQS